nr:hypothetical protein [Tanacetum cinerariifolium]
MPNIWTIYLTTLTQQKLVTRTHRAFDRVLRALPVTQHERIWELYLVFVSQKGVPFETSLRVYKRYLKYDPGLVEDLIEFLLGLGLWQEAAERLSWVLKADTFWSAKGKTKHQLSLELCDLLVNHASEISWLNVDAIIRRQIFMFNDKVGRLWTSLADYYIRQKLLEKARDVFEEGMTTVVTVRDFSDDDEEEEDGRLNVGKIEEKLKKFQLCDEKDVDLRIARFEHLLYRSQELANNVLLHCPCNKGDPQFDGDFWKKWHEFEVNHGNEDTFRNMLRIKRSVSARHSQAHVFLPEYLQKPSVDAAMDQLKRAGVPKDEMEALERQLAPKEDSAARKLGFVSYQELLQD